MKMMKTLSQQDDGGNLKRSSFYDDPQPDYAEGSVKKSSTKKTPWKTLQRVTSGAKNDPEGNLMKHPDEEYSKEGS